MKVVVALGGEIADGALLRHWVEGAELTVAADSGAEGLVGIGLRPDAVIGDFDSLPAERMEALRRGGVEIVTHPDPQNRTDGQVALELALERGAAEVVLLGARGGERLDHSLTNALFLASEEFASMPIRLISGWTEAVGLFGEASGYGRGVVTFAGEPGDYVSLVAVSERLGQVSTHGLVWSLEEASLSLGAPAGMSNELVAERGGFTLGEGVAIATHTYRQARLSSGPFPA